MTTSNPIIRIVDDEAVVRKALKFLLSLRAGRSRPMKKRFGIFDRRSAFSHRLSHS